MPKSVPVFTYNDIIEPPAVDYEDGDKKTMVGWLKHIFLYYTCEDNPDCIQIRSEDRKDYEKALDMAKKYGKMKRQSADEWEETATRKKQAAVLNSVRKELGYTEECYE